MNFKKLKLEFFHIRKAFREYHQGWSYIYNKFFLSKKIISLGQRLDKPVTHQDLSIHTMLGHQHVIMAIWSLASYFSASQVSGKLYLHSDGTLTARDKSILLKFFPEAEIVDPQEVLVKYAAEYNKYPRLKAFRLKHAENFFQTKLIDPYIISDKPYRFFLILIFYGFKILT